MTTDRIPSSVVLSTRFSLLRERAAGVARDAPSPNLHFEALNTLVEALDCLSIILRQRLPDAVYMTRLAELKRRSAFLQEAIDSAAEWHAPSWSPQVTPGSAPSRCCKQSKRGRTRISVPIWTQDAPFPR